MDSILIQNFGIVFLYNDVYQLKYKQIGSSFLHPHKTKILQMSRKTVPYTIIQHCQCRYCYANFTRQRYLTISIPNTDSRDKVIKTKKNTLSSRCDHCNELILILTRHYPEKSNPDFKIIADYDVHGNEHSGYCSDPGTFTSYDDEPRQCIFDIPLEFGDPIANREFILKQFDRLIDKTAYVHDCQCCGHTDTITSVDIISTDNISELSLHEFGMGEV